MKVVEKVRRYCPCCTDTHTVKIISQTKRTVVKKEEVEYESISLYCDSNDSYATDQEMAEKNEVSMIDAYRRKMGLLTSDEIVDLRKRYGISQRDLAIVLKWGLKTITRYEGKQLQDAAHDSILRKLDSDPEWFLVMLEGSKDSIPEGAYEKYRTSILKRYASLADEYMKKAVAAAKLNKE